MPYRTPAAAHVAILVRDPAGWRVDDSVIDDRCTCRPSPGQRSRLRRGSLYFSGYRTCDAVGASGATKDAQTIGISESPAPESTLPAAKRRGQPRHLGIDTPQ